MKKDYDLFIRDVLEEVSVQLGEGFRAVRGDVAGNNGTVMRQIIIYDSRQQAALLYGMDRYFELCRKQGDIRLIASDIVKQCRRQGKEPESADIRWFADWEKAGQRIIFRLSGTERNREMLADMPHRDIPHLGLSMIFCAVADAVSGISASIWVRNSHLDMWGITEDCLFAQAWKNTPVQMKASVESMDTVLHREKYAECAGKTPSLYILSNEQKLYGAGCMLYEGVLEQAAEAIGSGFYVLPSSVHEVLLYPSDRNCRKEADALSALVSEINRSDALREEDVLTDGVYYYDRNRHELSAADRTV